VSGYLTDGGQRSALESVGFPELEFFSSLEEDFDSLSPSLDFELAVCLPPPEGERWSVE